MKIRAHRWIKILFAAVAMVLVLASAPTHAARPRVIYDFSGHWTGTFRASGRDIGLVEANFFGDAGGGREVGGGFVLYSNSSFVYPVPINGRVVGQKVLRAILKGSDGEPNGSLHGVVVMSANRLRANFNFRDQGQLIRGTMVIHKDY